MRLEDYQVKARQGFRKCPSCFARRSKALGFNVGSNICKRCESRAYLVARKKIKEMDPAHRLVRLALKNGKLVRPLACPYCARANRPVRHTSIVAHHFDYSRPLDVLWMCNIHHKAWHKVFSPEWMYEKQKGDS